VIAQVDKQHAAMIADAMAPAGEPDFLADERLVWFSTIMRTVAMHFISLEAVRRRRAKPSVSRGQAHGRAEFVKRTMENATDILSERRQCDALNFLDSKAPLRHFEFAFLNFGFSDG
jgi:hypothetical protein